MIFLGEFGIKCATGLASILLCLDRLRTIFFNLHTRWVCLDLQIYTLKLFGLLVLGQYGRKGTTEYSKMRYLTLPTSLKKLSLIRIYGYRRIIHHLLSVIMIGGDIHYFVWVSCNFLALSFVYRRPLCQVPPFCNIY